MTTPTVHRASQWLTWLVDPESKRQVAAVTTDSKELYDILTGHPAALCGQWEPDLVFGVVEFASSLSAGRAIQDAAATLGQKIPGMYGNRIQEVERWKRQRYNVRYEEV